MHYAKKLVVLLTILPLILVVACRQETEIRTGEQETAAVDQPNLESFRADVQSELQGVDEELTQLDQELAQATEEEMDDLRNQADELRQQRMEIEQDLQQLRAEMGWEDTRRNLQRRVDELAVDVSRARLDAASTLEEFRNLAQNELNQIDRKMSELEERHQMTSAGRPATGTQPGYDPGADDGVTDDGVADQDRGMADDDIATPDRDVSDGIGITSDGLTGGTDTEIDNLRQERQELSHELDQLATTTEDEFVDLKDELADAIADLNADVRMAVLRVEEEYDFARTEPQPGNQPAETEF